MRSAKLVIYVCALCAFALACGQGTPIATRAPTPAIQPSDQPTTQPFAFGVEYMLPGLAQIYAQAGARSTRPAAETFGWREVEPNAPRDGAHDYKWDKVDRYITEYQNAGFDQIQIYTTAWNEWASPICNISLITKRTFSTWLRATVVLCPA
jgi:hypothetical protein